MKLLVPFGTRPEIIKLSAVVAALRRTDFDVTVLATGQHYDRELRDVFSEALSLVPDESWTLEGDEGNRVGSILAGAYRAVERHRPDAVMVLGDTNTVPLFGLAARRHGVPVVHLEAGLRSFNERSLEEVNRKVAAATASLHLAPTEMAASFLRNEGIEADRIAVVGNPVCDALRQMRVTRRPLADRDHVLVTAHRATNVDDPVCLERVVEIVARLAAGVGHVVFPVHPRTRSRLDSTALMARLQLDNIELRPPLPYAEMVRLIATACVVVTDSGGLQEEASWLGVPVVVLRSSTPRWESVEAGTSEVVGLEADRAIEAAQWFCLPEEQERVNAVPCLYGDGRAAERIVSVLRNPAALAQLDLREPIAAIGRIAG